MSLTRRLLKELELSDSAIERVIAAHTATVDALKQERSTALAEAESAAREQLDAARQEAAASQSALASYRAQVEESQHRDARRAYLSEALKKQGANPQAVPLMLDAITLPEDAWQGDILADPAAALHPFQEKYGPLFAHRTPLPITRVEPPVATGGALTRADVKHMSAEDINRNWSAVKTALQR